MGWHPDFVGQFASYDPAVASLPGGATEGFYSMTPALYAYPDDPRPEVEAFARAFKARYGIDPNSHGEQGWTAAQFVLLALQKAGRDLTVENFITAMESIKDFRPIFGGTLSLRPDMHQASNASFLAVVRNGRWVPVPNEVLAY